MKENAKHEKRKDKLSQQLKNKSNYEVFFFFFFFFFVAFVSNGKSFKNQSNFEDNSSSIFFDAKKNARKSKLVIETSSLSNNDAMMIEGLGYEEDIDNN